MSYIEHRATKLNHVHSITIDIIRLDDAHVAISPH